MKVLFPVLVLCTIAVVAVVVAIHVRVKKHLRDTPPTHPASDLPDSAGRSEPDVPPAADAIDRDHSS